MMQKRKGPALRKSNGFTLIEILVVIAIIAILAIVVFVALNPAKRIADSKDSRRTTDVDSILTAVHSYIVDNKGALPDGLTNNMAERELGTPPETTGAIADINGKGGCATATDTVLDMSTPLVKYLKSIPADPDGTAALTKYSIAVDANGIITVRACGAENTTVSSSR